MKYPPLVLCLLVAIGAAHAQTNCNEVVNALVVEASNSGPYCPEQQMVLTGSGSSMLNNNIAVNYLWSGPNGYNSSEQNPTDVTEAGIYELSLQVGECTSNAVSTEIVVWEAENFLTVEANNSGPYCQGRTIQLTGSGSSILDQLTGSGSSILNQPIQFSWAGPNGYQSGDLNPTDVLEAGIYELTASINGCATVTASTEVTIQEPPTSLLEETLCSGEGVLVNGHIYNEQFPKGTEILSNAAVNGCDSIVEINLSFKPKTISFLDTTLCRGETVELFGTVFDEQNPSGMIPINGNNTCDSLVVQLHYQAPIVGAISGPSVIEEGEPATLTLQLSGADIYQVTLLKDNGETSVFENVVNGEELTIALEQAAFYRIVDLQNKEGETCEVSLGAGHRVLVRRPQDNHLYFPNVFSPNNDGTNDKFFPYADEEVQVIKTFQIFDRWGSLFFERTDFPPNDDSFGWDGTYRSQLIAPQVLVFFAKVILADGSEQFFTGDVAVLSQ